MGAGTARFGRRTIAMERYHGGCRLVAYPFGTHMPAADIAFACANQVPSTSATPAEPVLIKGAFNPIYPKEPAGMS